MCLPGSVLVILSLLLTSAHVRQRADRADAPPPVCDQQRGILLVQDQLAWTLSSDDAPKRIAVLTRGADLLWEHLPGQARKTFEAAYEAAEGQYRAVGDRVTRERRMLTQHPDLRFRVIQAIARRDPAWAARLTREIAETQAKTADGKEGDAGDQDTPGPRRPVSDKTLELARSILPFNKELAIRLARASISGEPSALLPMFLYSLAETDPGTADAMFAEALGTYQTGTLEGLFYLSVYPFGLNRPVGPVRSQMYYIPPTGFTPSGALQVAFLDALFRRAAAVIQVGSQDVDVSGRPESAKLAIAFDVLDPVISSHQPSRRERALALRASLNVLVPADAREQLAALRSQVEPPPDPFEHYLERAEMAGEGRGDSWYSLALLTATSSESFERLAAIAERIEDAGLRDQIMEWLHYRASQNAIKEGRLDDARRHAEGVSKLERRAYLAYEIAQVALKGSGDESRAREILESIVVEALRAPESTERARMLLGVTNLFARFDGIRALEVMGLAVKTINRLENPDLASERLLVRIEGRAFGYYAGFNVAGFNIERSFGELAPFDFEGVRLLVDSLDDRYLRALATLAVADGCLKKRDGST